MCVTINYDTLCICYGLAVCILEAANNVFHLLMLHLEFLRDICACFHLLQNY